MRPTSDTTILRPDLGIVAFEAMQDSIMGGYIADILMPTWRVGVYTGSYDVIPIEALFNISKDLRANDGSYPLTDWEFESGYYETQNRGGEVHIDERRAKMYANRFDYEAMATRIRINEILRAREYRVQQLLHDTTYFTNTTALTTPWNDATADPLQDIDTAKEAMKLLGIYPNLLQISDKQFNYLTKVTKVIAAVTNIFPDTAKDGVIGKSHLETYLKIPIAIGGSMMNTAKKGQTASLSEIWDDEYAMLCKVASSPDIVEPSVGRTALWIEESGGGSEGEGMLIVEEYEMPGNRGKRIRARYDIQEHFIASRNTSGTIKSNISVACGHLFSNVVHP